MMNRIKYQNLEVIMFLVFNKEKIQTYIVSVLTVAVLITIANVRKVETIQTSSQEKELPIYNVQTDEKKVAFTMNCAWNADDIDKILETLQKNNVKITFFLVGEWVDKYPEAVKKIAEAGHEIGTHSNTHPHVNKLSSEKSNPFKCIRQGIIYSYLLEFQNLTLIFVEILQKKELSL